MKTNLDDKNDKFLFNFFGIVSSIIVFKALFDILTEQLLITKLTFSLLILNIAIYYALKKVEIRKRLILSFTFYNIICLINFILSWDKFPMEILFFVLLGYSLYLYTNTKTMLVYLFVIALILIATPSISAFIKMNIQTAELINITDQNKMTSNLFLTCVMILTLILVHRNRHEIGVFNVADDYIDITNIDNSFHFNTEKKSYNYKTDDKYGLLYKEIIELMETKKPFQNTNYNLHLLARDLGSNETYVSRAINNCSEYENFKALINFYRITQVVQEFENQNYKTSSIKEIHTRAGFSYQATFNSIFKKHTNLTPSEYIDKVKAMHKIG